MTPRTGFTLIEVMVVVVLIGLLAGAAAVSLTGDLDRATHEDVIGRLTYADAQARMAGRRLGPATLRIDLDQQAIWLVTPDDQSAQPRPGHVMRLGEGYTIREVMWIDPEPMAAKTTRPRRRVSRQAGRVEIAFSSEGLSRTYALRLEGPATDEPGGAAGDSARRSTWLLFAGMTGQVMSTDEPEPIDKLLAELARTRPDAD